MWKHTMLLAAVLGVAASAQSVSETFGPVHQVKKGMSPDDAQRILGAPTATVSFLGVEEWHYCAAAAPFRTVIFYFDAGHVIGKLDSESRDGYDAEPCAGVFVGGVVVFPATVTLDPLAFINTNGRYAVVYGWRSKVPGNVKELWATRAPIVILITSSSLPGPVALGAWEDNMRFLSAVERPANVAPGAGDSRVRG